MVPPRAGLDFAARTQESQFHRDIMTEKSGIANVR